MSNRPKPIYIGSDTFIDLVGLTNELTGAIVAGAVGGTLKLYDGNTNALLHTLSLTEVLTEPGTYQAVATDTITITFAEGLPLLLIFDISGGSGLTLRLSAKGIAITKKDEAGIV